MKVEIITVLDNTNFGTYLQALATSKAIISLGHNAEIIRYTRPSMTGVGQCFRLLKDRGVLSWLRNVWKIPGVLKLRNKDYNYLIRHAAVTDEYVGYDSLIANPPIADVYLTGSDQVWNSIYNRGVDKSFYLEFAPIGKRRVAYAASIGMDSIPLNERVETVGLLKKYNSITVRESAAKNLLQTLGINTKVVLDPTLLIDSQQWSAIAEENNIDFDDNYLLIYSVERKAQNKLINYYASLIAKEKNLKIYQVSYSGSAARIPCVDKYFAHATPDIFLNLMKKASFVVVSSFHGTAFSVNFNKQFLTISANRFNSRVQNLLDITKLQSRLIVDNSFDLSKIQNIDYTDVNKLISIEREKSLLLLKSIIEL